jgi:hypothetical protein
LKIHIPATQQALYKEIQAYSIKKTITKLKNRTKNYRKNYISNSNPTHGQKKGYAGHVKTGQTKCLIPRCDFLSLQPNGAPNNCVLYK